MASKPCCPDRWPASHPNHRLIERERESQVARHQRRVSASLSLPRPPPDASHVHQELVVPIPNWQAMSRSVASLRLIASRQPIHRSPNGRRTESSQPEKVATRGRAPPVRRTTKLLAHRDTYQYTPHGLAMTNISSI